MASFSLTSLSVFCEVVRQKSFSRAAEALSMTQPGVSKHIAQLEALAGSVLLLRGKGVLEPTKKGKTVLKYAERIVRLARDLESALKHEEAKGQSVLKIGTTRTYARVMMPYILGAFQRVNPQVMIKLDVGGSEEMEQTLSSSRNDIVIIANPTQRKSLTVFPLLKEELSLITGRGHTLSGRTSVALSEIKDFPLIIREEGSATRRVILSALDRSNIAPAVLIEAKSTEFIKEWVTQGKGVAVLSERALTSEEKTSLTVIPFTSPLSFTMCVVCLKARQQDPWIQRFITLTREMGPEPCR